MPRPRGFDENDAVRAAAVVFTRLGYEGASVDDLVRHLGVHRGSLYRVFGSKLGLFHRALRQVVDAEVLPWARTLTDAGPAAAPEGLGLFLVAAVVSEVHAALTDRLGRGRRPEATQERVAAVIGRAVLERAGVR